MGNLIVTASAILKKKKKKKLESHVEICTATMTNLIQCQSKLSNSIFFKHITFNIRAVAKELQNDAFLECYTF
jgi:hypothetical protein